MPSNKEIVYPIFLECCQHADNMFWENIFEKLAYGKTPYGTYISNNFLCCGYKDKKFTYKITNKDSLTIYSEVYSILVNKLGILSQSEKMDKKKEFNNIGQHMKEKRKVWSSISKKNIKELLIELYVNKMKKKHNLTLQQSQYLLSIIFISMVFKVIKTDDIEYDGDKITNIKGIDFKNSEIVVEKGVYNIKTNFTVATVSDKKVMADKWEKYCDSLRKLKVKK